jgi:hypothetical protein
MDGKAVIIVLEQGAKVAVKGQGKRAIPASVGASDVKCYEKT